jgi:hypothetical protein
LKKVKEIEMNEYEWTVRVTIRDKKTKEVVRVLENWELSDTTTDAIQEDFESYIEDKELSDRQPIGAHVVVKWKSDGGLESTYMSFSPEVYADNDKYGVHDDYIFFYTTLEELQTDGAFSDWDVVEYSLVFDKDEV